MAAASEADRPQVGSTQPRVRVITELGDLVICIEADRAPLSSAAFLKQVDAGTFDAGVFWRSVRRDTDRGAPTIEVVQAAGVTAPENDLVPLESTLHTGLRHLDGTVSLPRGAGGPSSATGFFICLGNQPGLDAGTDRNVDGQGFAAFGRVVEGMELVREIHSRETSDEAPTDFIAGQILAQPVHIYEVARDPETADEKLAKLARDFWAFRIREFPMDASGAGVSSADPLMDGAREEDHVRRSVTAGAMLKRLTTIDSTTLTDDDRVTLALLKRQLELIVEGFELQEYYRPLLFPFGFADVPTMLAQQTPLLTAQAREDFAKRLKAIPQYLRESLGVLQAGVEAGYRVPRVLLPRILQMLDSHLAPSGLEEKVSKALESPLPGLPVAQTEEQRTRIAQIASDAVVPALRQVRDVFAGFGERELTDNIAVSAQPNGRHFYRYKVRQQTSLDLDPDAVHQLGLDEITRINSEMEAVLVEMGRAGECHKVAEELDARLADDGLALLTYVRAIAKKIDGLLPRLIGRLPRNTYAVEAMTAEASVSQPPALAQPAPADRSMPGIFWLTALPEKCPLHLVIPLTLHEAWPGHLMQLGLAHELSELPEFRRFCWMDYNAYVEGWALYAERLGQDVGLYSQPADQFGLLTFELWRAARLVVDTGIHWKGWSRVQAIDFLRANSFLPLPTIEAEVDRYIGMPAQALSYKVGERTIVELRMLAESALADRFSLRDFHDKILATGPVTLEVLREEVQQWVNRQEAA